MNVRPAIVRTAASVLLAGALFAMPAGAQPAPAPDPAAATQAASTRVDPVQTPPETAVVDRAPDRETEPEAGAAFGLDPDAAPLSPEQLDPWQPFNRRMHGFNRGLDRAILRPAARGYVKVVPQVLRRGVSNFFNNLYQPVTALNYLLQGEPRRAGSATGRFLMNATLGLGGVLDPATHAGVGYYENDFGQTLAHWGWRRSRYLVLPLFGPATVRDGLGKGIATRASPVSYVAEEWGPGVSLLYGVDARASGLPAEAFLEGAEDEYLLIRDAYLQRRRCQLEDCSEELPEYLLPDYEVELPDFEWRRR